MLPLIKHPLSLGILVLRISSVLRILVSKIVISWFGYSLFLVYVGGILVIFSYVVALAPNLIGLNFSYLVGWGGCFLIVNWVLVSYLELNWSLNFNSMFEASLIESRRFIGLFNTKNVTIIVFLLVMLLATIVMVVKICFYRSGPLRPFN